MISISLPTQPSSVTDDNIDLWLLDRTKWVLDGSAITENGARIQPYKYNDGDSRYPLRATVKQQVDKSGALPLQRNTLMLYPTIKRADDVAETDVAVGEAGFGIIFNVPADNSISQDDVYKWLTAAFGAMFKTATAGVGDKESINSLYRRILAIL